MKKSSKFSDILHILLHMAGATDPVTSEMLAKSMKSNPVVVRRVMAGLKKKGFVQSEKGHGGGWGLSCDLSNVTMYDIYTAVESPTLIAMQNRNDTPKCLVENAINNVTNQAFKEAENVLLKKFKRVTLQDLYDDIKKKNK